MFVKDLYTLVCFLRSMDKNLSGIKITPRKVQSLIGKMFQESGFFPVHSESVRRNSGTLETDKTAYSVDSSHFYDLNGNVVAEVRHSYGAGCEVLALNLMPRFLGIENHLVGTLYSCEDKDFKPKISRRTGKSSMSLSEKELVSRYLKPFL